MRPLSGTSWEWAMRVAKFAMMSVEKVACTHCECWNFRTFARTFFHRFRLSACRCAAFTATFSVSTQSRHTSADSVRKWYLRPARQHPAQPIAGRPAVRLTCGLG